MSVSGDQSAVSLPDAVWEQLASLDASHQLVLRKHEQHRRSLDEAIVGWDDAALRSVWDAYRKVVADLDKVTEDIEALRMTAG